MTVRALCDGTLRAGLLALTVCAAGACTSAEREPTSSVVSPRGMAGADGDDDDADFVPLNDGGAVIETRDAGSGSVADAGAGSADAAATLGCSLVSRAGAPIVDPEVMFPQVAFSWSGDGAVGVWPTATGTGYRLIELDRTGTARAPVRTLWPAETASEPPSIAVSGGVLALADRLKVGVNGRRTCRLGLSTLSGDSILAPKRVSDVPDDETGLHEAFNCQVVAVQDGVLVVWHQRTGEQSPAISTFAQGFGLDGQARGARLTLDTSAAQPDQPWVTSDGTRALVAHADDGELLTPFTVVDGEQIDTVEIELEERIKELGSARGEYLVRTSSFLRVLDRELQLVRGPIDVGPRATIAPLGDGYVAVSNEDFVVARAYDGELAASSPVVMLSQDRAALAQSLVYAPDGSSTALILLVNSRVMYVQFMCRTETRQ
jgi:hypothetical protein